MRFGHMRLHPNDSSWELEKIRKVLSEKHLVGIGSDNYSVSSFRQCAEGDIIAVVHQSKAVALVRVLSPVEVHEPDANLDWFDLACKIEVLEYASDVFTDDESSFPMKRSIGAFMWAKGKSDTRDFIESWYNKFFLRNVKSEVVLNNDQKTKLQKLFENYKPNWNEGSLENTLADWKKYCDKINSKEGLTLEEYTNLMENISSSDCSLPGGYLCNFLEKKSKAFGYSRPGTSQQYMVHLNAPEKDAKTKSTRKSGGIQISREVTGEKTYFIKDKVGNKLTEKGSEADAQSFYNENIKELLIKLTDVTKLEDILEIEESNKQYENYEAKQILQKIVVLSNVDKDIRFVHIYEKKAIDFLFTFFFGPRDVTSSFYSKNNSIAIAAESFLIKDSAIISDLEYWRKVSAFLWDLANSDNLGSKESPNIIFYGAPGTGKTYTVLNGVKFVTKNDPSLYEKIQFHPSFTYEDFIDGLKPVGITDSGNMKFEFINGVFKDFCIRAKKNPKETYYFVVDEVNRANLSTVFGETLSLLETDYRYTEGNKYLIKTQNCNILESLIKCAKKELEMGSADEKIKKEEKLRSLINLAFDYDETSGAVSFGIPANIRFIGMMNDVDKSIDSFDLALRRRFKWVHKSCDYDVVEDYYSKNDDNDERKIAEYVDHCKKLNRYISKSEGGLGLGSSYEFGHSFFMKLINRKVTKENSQDLFNNHLKPTLKEYLRGFFEENEIDSKLTEAGKIFGVISDKKKENDNEN